MTAVAGSPTPPTIDSVDTPTDARRDRAEDPRAPRRASTRVIVLVALGLVLLSTIFTFTGADAAKARDPLHRERPLRRAGSRG